MTDPIAFVDLQAQRQRLGNALPAAIDRVLSHGGFIIGPEVTELEDRLARFCQAKHAITCANGTEALILPMMAWGIGPGDAVFVPSFTFIATAEAPALLGATPFFVDVEPDSFNLDPDGLDQAVEEAKRLGLKPRAVIPVDLFGLPADHPRISAIAKQHGLLVLDDGAQGFGGQLGNHRIGRFGDATSTSFFPAKPLGCYGDGGAVFTDDDDLAEVLRSLRVHGKGSDKYDNVRIGLNARLDTLQAAILLEKLKLFEDELEARHRIADHYTAGLSDIVRTPVVPAGARSSWAQYTIQTDNRQRVMETCGNRGIPTQVYYRIPLHRQSGYRHFPSLTTGCPVSERLAETVVSLPMHPYLTDDQQQRVIDAVRAGIARS